MADTKISDLTTLASVADGDLLPIVDISDTSQGSAGSTRKITKANLVGSFGDVSSNTSSSVDNEVALFNGTAGKTIKRASATGIAKLASGVLSAVTAPSGTIVGDNDTQTLTNKRVNSRIQSITDNSSVTPNADSDDCVDITALTQTIAVNAPSGTPVNFQKLIIRFKDNGTGRTINWNAAFTAGGVALPTTTTASKILTVGFIYNTANSLNKWQCVASANEA